MVMIPEHKTVIHPDAVVHPGAELDEGVSIGTCSLIGPQVRIGSGSLIGPNVVLTGKTTLGRGNRVLPFAALGGDPQDLKYRDEDTEVIIGDDNVFGECTTVHRGTVTGRGVTTIGSRNIFMPCSHVAHDSIVGNGTKYESGANPGGHVDVGDGAHMGSFCAVHPFCRIGEWASVDRGCIVVKDVPPFSVVRGDRAQLVGLNEHGLKNAGFEEEVISRLQDAFDKLFRSGLRFEEALGRIEAGGDPIPEIERLMDFLGSSKRGFTR